MIFPQSTDHSRVGIYPVTLTSSVSIPDDYTYTTFTEYSITEDFDLFVEPCRTTSVTSLSTIADLSYDIGAPGGVASQSYSFAQEPADCDYEIEIIITGLEPFMVHDEFSQTIIVPETSDSSLEGTYLVTIEGRVSHFSNSLKFFTRT